MIALLVVITLASLALSGALLVYVLKQSREERDRSEARAAALAELLEVRTDGEQQSATASPILAARIAPEPPVERVVRGPGTSVEIPLIVQDDPVPAGEPSHADLFASASTAAPEYRMRRLLAPAIGIELKWRGLVPDLEGGFWDSRHGIGFRSLTSISSR